MIKPALVPNGLTGSKILFDRAKAGLVPATYQSADKGCAMGMSRNFARMWVTYLGQLYPIQFADTLRRAEKLGLPGSRLAIRTAASMHAERAGKGMACCQIAMRRSFKIFDRRLI